VVNLKLPVETIIERRLMMRLPCSLSRLYAVNKVVNVDPDPVDP
jgi:hypothetical protein